MVLFPDDKSILYARRFDPFNLEEGNNLGVIGYPAEMQSKGYPQMRMSFETPLRFFEEN